GDDGKAVIPLPPGTAENAWVSLYVIGSPEGTDLAMVSPYDGRTPVPSFKNSAENFVRVVVVQRGDKAALQDGSVLAALVAKINRANASKENSPELKEENLAESRKAVAKQYGLGPEE